MALVGHPQIVRVGDENLQAMQQLGQGGGQLLAALLDYYRRQGPQLYQSPLGNATQISPAERVASSPNVRLADVLRQQTVPSTFGTSLTPSRLPFLGQLPVDSTQQANALALQQAQAQVGNLPLERQKLQSDITESQAKSGYYGAQAKFYDRISSGEITDVPAVRDGTTGEIRPARPDETPTMVISSTKQGKQLKPYADEEAKSQQKELSAARKALDTYTSDATQTLVALDKIEQEARRLGDFERGLLPQAIAKVSTTAGKFSKEKNITRYLGVVSQELIPAARKLMEEKGPITEFDVARVERGLGELTTPLEDKLYLLNELRNKVRQALANKQDVAKVSEEEFTKKYQTLSNQLGTSAGVTPNGLRYTVEE